MKSLKADFTIECLLHYADSGIALADWNFFVFKIIVIRYNDTDLQPYTNYTYQVESMNDHGSALSPAVTFRTPVGAPSGDLVLTVSDVSADSAEFSWTLLNNSRGDIGEYMSSSLVTMVMVFVFKMFYKCFCQERKC